jgi:hypothetical protein
MKAKLDSNQEEIKASKEEIIVEMKVWLEEIKAYQEPGRTEIKTGLEEVMAMDLEANPEEIDIVAEHQEVPNEESVIERIGALRTYLVAGDRSWDAGTH